MKFTSPVFSAVSGSIAGVTYSHNRGGMYTRARAVPTNPNTVRQQQARSNFNAAVIAWSSALSAAERAAWNTYAANVPVTNKLGATVHLSGQQMFIRSYSFGMIPEVFALFSPPTSGPTTFDTGGAIWRIKENGTDLLDTIGTAVTTGDMNTNFTFTSPVDSASALVIFVGPVQNPGVNFYKGPYRLSQVIAVSSASDSEDWTTAQNQRLDGYPVWVTGDRVPLRARLFQGDGRLSQEFSGIFPVLQGT